MRREVERGLWPVDWLVLAYLALVGLTIAAFAHKIEHAGLLLLAHAAAGSLVIAYALRPRLPGAFYFRNIYPLPYVFASYRVMSLLIHSVRTTHSDSMLAAWDFAIWHANPTVWLERFQFPWLTELMEVIYALFVPVVLAVAILLWIRQRKDFRSYSFVLTFGFLVSYALYFAVPARGPRIFLDDLQTQPLTGLWLYQPLRSGLDVLESSHFDCFPSGHVEMAILAWWTARGISKRLSYVYFGYTVLILLATVYLRYHYTVDLVAGVAVAALVLYAAPHLEQASMKRERQFQDEPTRDFAPTK